MILVRYAANLVLVLSLGFVPGACFAKACDGASNALYLDGEEPRLDNSELTQRSLAVCYQEYHLYASNVTGGNLWAAEHLTKQKVAGADAIPRIDSKFFGEAGFEATHASYTNSGYDRGHMMPAGDASTTSAQKETFSVANIVPQTAKLNRGPWAKIESIVRMVASAYDDAYVVTGPDFENMATTIANGTVVVPTHAWKACTCPWPRWPGHTGARTRELRFVR